MEAFKIYFMVTKENGASEVVSVKRWSATGWEAREKACEYIWQNKSEVKNVRFLKWRVLPGFEFHFQLNYDFFPNKKILR